MVPMTRTNNIGRNNRLKIWLLSYDNVFSVFRRFWFELRPVLFVPRFRGVLLLKKINFSYHTRTQSQNKITKYFVERESHKVTLYSCFFVCSLAKYQVNISLTMQMVYYVQNGKRDSGNRYWTGISLFLIENIHGNQYMSIRRTLAKDIQCLLFLKEYY